MTICTEFWASLEARDWDRFGATVTADVIAEWPQSRERVRGRDALVRFMVAFPGDWHLRVDEEHTDPSGGATRISFTLDGETVAGVTFFRTDGGGRIESVTEFWPEPYEPAARPGAPRRAILTMRAGAEAAGKDASCRAVPAIAQAVVVQVAPPTVTVITSPAFVL